MQTFLPYRSFERSARVLDNRRLGKQRVEARQILNVLTSPPFRCRECGEPCFRSEEGKPRCVHYPDHDGVRKAAWLNHPAVVMWRGYVPALTVYFVVMCEEWVRRGFRQSMCYNLTQLGVDKSVVVYPNWLGNRKFHQSHRSNLLRKNPAHYRKFWKTERDNLPYIWPTN